MTSKRTFSFFCCILVLLAAFCSCGSKPEKSGLGNGWEPIKSAELQYAENFSVDYYQGGYKLITLANGDRFLVIPEGKSLPEKTDADIIPLYQPIEKIYVATTPALCLFDALNSLGNIGFSGSKANDLYIDNARAAMQRGDILFAGKYSEPDYELILSSGCPLAVQSTMINHAPEVKEKLEELGIPVFIDQSSLESHPLGRTEWIKLYAALLNEEKKAERLFSEQVEYLNSVSNDNSTGKTVVFFYINSSGYPVVRKAGDYIAKMMELAGGDYIFKNIGDPTLATSTVTLEMEQFYADAKEADFIIYNSAFGGDLKSIDELIAKNELLRDFKAVQNGNVWCTDKRLYHDTTQLGKMVKDIHEMLINQDPNMTKLEFLYKLQ